MRLRAVLVVVAALPALAACGDHTTTEPSKNTGGCTGSENGGIALAQGSSYDLANGVIAALDSASMTNDPPTMSLNLQNVPANESDVATRVSVGDTFEVKGVTYRVTMVCQNAGVVEEVS